MSDEFEIDNEHEHVSFLFDDSNMVQNFIKAFPNHNHTMISGELQTRLTSAVDQFTELSSADYAYKHNAIKKIYADKDAFNTALRMAGFPSDSSIIGTTICLNCLERAIFSCKEVIDILTDIKSLVNASK